MLGIYGMLSYAVATRRQEIGVRMALGATRARVYRLTMEQAARPVAAGLLGGLMMSAASARVIERFLSGMSGMDAGMMAGVAVVFAVAAAVAAFVPARRAASIEPMEALRAEEGHAPSPSLTRLDASTAEGPRCQRRATCSPVGSAQQYQGSSR